MKTISAELQAHLEQEVTTLATCWKISRRDSVVMGFTDADEDVVMGGVTYEAATGFTPTAVAASAALNVDNMDVEGMLSAGAITEEDVLAGLYDFAELEVCMVNVADLTQGKMVLRTGWLGEVTMRQGRFVAEVRGLTQALGQRVGQSYSPACRASLGDSRCGVNMAGYTHAGTISVGGGRTQFEDSGSGEDAGYFAFGVVTFGSGANAGLSMEVKEYGSGRFVLALPMPYDIEAGDSYVAKAGCDKTIVTCAARFGNAVNFRGEPHVPGTDRLLETSGTRSEW